jgi:hypothetical protein
MTEKYRLPILLQVALWESAFYRFLKTWETMRIFKAPASLMQFSLCSEHQRAYVFSMSKPPNKKKAMMLGLGLDSDGHKRVTTGDNFALVGGSQETHEEMTEKAIKINEKLKAKGKTLEQVSRPEFDEIADSVGLKRRLPEKN